MTRRKAFYSSLTLLLVLSLFFISPVRAIVKLEYLGPYPLKPQLISVGRLQANAIVGNAGDEAANITFKLIANPDLANQFRYSLLVNNTNVSSFTLSAGRRQIFYATFDFEQSTPVQSYNATISITAVPASAQTGTAAVESFNIPVSITASSMTGTPVQTASSSTTSNSENSSSTQTSSSMSETDLFTQSNLIAIGALVAVIILAAMYLNLRRKKSSPPQDKTEKTTEEPSETKEPKTEHKVLETEKPQLFCSRCGADLTAGAKFCDKCGLPITAG